VIVGAEAIYPTENARSHCHGHAAGRLSVDVDVDLPVDQTPVQSEQCPSFAHSGRDGRRTPVIDFAKSGHAMGVAFAHTIDLEQVRLAWRS
jgi:hypothetical protein